MLRAFYTLLLMVALGSVDRMPAFAQPPSTDSTRIGDGAEVLNPLPPTSPRDLRPRVGERFTEPPPVPPVPQSLTEQLYEENSGPLSLDAIEAMACRNNPTLAQAQAQIQGELGKAIQAGLAPNPQLRYVAEQVGVGGTAGEWQGAIFSQRIVTAKKLQLSRAKFLQLTRSAQWHALEKQFQVLNDLRMQYWMALGAHQKVQIHEEILKNAEDGVITARELYNAGQATRADLHDANVRLQMSRLALMAVRNDLRQSWWELMSIAGLRMNVAPLEGTLDGPVSPIEFETALDRLLTNSPQILAARAKLQADEIKVRRETVQPIPDVVVSYGYGHNFEARENTHNVGVGIEVPLFDWNQGTIRQAEADVVRQRGELQRVEFDLQRQLARVYQQYLTAMQNVRSYQAVMIPEARRAYEVLLDAYEEDRVDWPQVLEHQVNYYRLQSQYVDHLVAWRSNETLIAGYLLNGGLTPPTGPRPPGHISAVPKPR